MSINFYWGTIARGQTLWPEWGWTSGNGDRGAIFQMASPLGTATLLSGPEIKYLDQNGHYWYGVVVTNEGPADVGFNLQGGGLN